MFCDGSRHVIIFSSGTVINSYFYGGFGEPNRGDGTGLFSTNLLVAYRGDARGYALVFENDFLVNDTPNLDASGLFAHAAAGPNGYDSSYIKNVYTYKCSSGSFGATGRLRMDVLHSVADQTGGVGGYAAVTNVQDSLLIGAGASSGWVFGGDSVVTINNCRFANVTDLNRFSAAGAGSISVTNSDIYNASATTQGNALVIPYGQLPAVFNLNVVQNAYYYLLVPTGYAADYNVYWHSNGSGGYWQVGGGALYSVFSDYTTAYPTEDVHSVFADPLYLGDPAQDNWTKNGASPAVTLGAGANANCATRPDWNAIIALMRAL